MEFKVGDRVIKNKQFRYDKYCKFGGNKIDVPLGTKGKIEELVEDGYWVMFDNKIKWKVSEIEITLLTEDEDSNTKKMEKIVFRILAVDKKTGNEVKNVTVVAENKELALLKAFGVKDAENLFIKPTEEGKFEVKELVNAVLVDKKKE